MSDTPRPEPAPDGLDEFLRSDTLWNIYKNIDTPLMLVQFGTAIYPIVAAERTRARIVELDLLEQAINAGRDISKYKLQRLDDLQKRLEKAEARTGTDGGEAGE